MNEPLYASANEVLARVNSHTKGFIARVMLDTAAIAHGYFVDNRIPIVHPDFSKSIDPRNMNASFNSAFHADYLPSNRPFNVSIEKLNAFGHRCSCIELDNIVMHIGKINSPASLPPTAKYKKKRASQNIFASDLDSFQTSMDPLKYYVIIGYRLNRNYELSGIDLLVPDRYYTRCLQHEDLLQYKDMRLEVLTKQPARSAETVIKKDKIIKKEQDDAES